MNDAHRLILWSYGAMRQMRIWGLVSGPDCLTTKGLAASDQLIEGWKPDNDELKAAAAALVKTEKEENALFELLKGFRDNREAMEKFVRKRN